MELALTNSILCVSNFVELKYLNLIAIDFNKVKNNIFYICKFTPLLNILVKIPLIFSKKYLPIFKSDLFIKLLLILQENKL